MTQKFQRSRAYDPDAKWRRDPGTIKPEDDTVTCAGCDSPWLEAIQVTRFKKFYQTIPGQQPVAKHDGFWLFRCIRCGLLQEPEVSLTQSDANRLGYNELLDMLDPGNNGPDEL